MTINKIIIFILLVPFFLCGQVLIPNVSIDSERIESSYLPEIEELEQQIAQYIQTESFSDETYDFQIPYRISIFVRSIDESGTDRVYTCEAFFTNDYDQRYYDPQWKFEYSSGSSLYRSMGIFNPLTDIIDYYGYLIVGTELDAIELLGGNAIFEKANQIIQRSQSSRWSSGWRSRIADFESITRNYRLRKARFYLSEAFWAVEDQKKDLALSKLKESLSLIQEIIRIRNKDKFTNDFIESHYKDAEYFLSALKDTSFMPLYRDITPNEKKYFDSIVDKYY
ncbi:DUF4835 family protein [Fidelibacter multiformis]|uniref:type IX secretion component PorD family protein n=1 Tax=Fidelibacter multiformis TaxID=3377529 RepID=UPI0037DBF8CE